jgi:hypothetical protein
MVLEDAFAEIGIKFSWLIFISYPPLEVDSGTEDEKSTRENW